MAQNGLCLNRRVRAMRPCPASAVARLGIAKGLPREENRSPNVVRCQSGSVLMTGASNAAPLACALGVTPKWSSGEQVFRSEASDTPAWSLVGNATPSVEGASGRGRLYWQAGTVRRSSLWHITIFHVPQTGVMQCCRLRFKYVSGVSCRRGAGQPAPQFRLRRLASRDLRASR